MRPGPDYIRVTASRQQREPRHTAQTRRTKMTDAALVELGPVDSVVVEFPAGASSFTGEFHHRHDVVPTTRPVRATPRITSPRNGPTASRAASTTGSPDDIAENLAMLDDLGSPKTYNHYPQRLGDGVQRTVQDVEALRVQRRQLGPVHDLVAEGHLLPRTPPVSRHSSNSPRKLTPCGLGHGAPAGSSP
jgi:hypothetical protein